VGVTDGAVELAVGVDGDANQRRGCGVLLLAIRRIRIRQRNGCLTGGKICLKYGNILLAGAVDVGEDYFYSIVFAEVVHRDD
jgi:hypothetical protein